MNSGSMEPTTTSSEAVSSAPENSEPKSNSSFRERLPESQQIDAIADLLGGGGKPDDQHDMDPTDSHMDRDGDEPVDHSATGDSAPDHSEASALTPAALAEKLEMSPDDVYSMEIKVGDDTFTLGELKDAQAGREALAAEMQEKDSALNDRESGLVTDIQSLGILDAMEALPENIRQQANNHLTAMAEREYQKFLALYPDMQDDATRLAFDKGVNDWLGEYGVSPGQFPVRTLGMYRLMKETIQMRKELAALKKPKPAKAPKSAKPQRRAPPKAQKAPMPRSGGHIQQQTDAIAALMTGKRR